MSPVHRAEVRNHGAPPFEHVVVHFKDAARLKEFAASLVEMADSPDFDHVHLQDHKLSKDTPGIEVVVVRNKQEWE